jgi:hypothetical protein
MATHEDQIALTRLAFWSRRAASSTPFAISSRVVPDVQAVQDDVTQLIEGAPAELEIERLSVIRSEVTE